jgi:hypothetical protein
VKANEIFEMALRSASSAKDKKLKAFLTPENIAANYEKVIAALGHKLSLGDIDELAADISGKEIDADELLFQYRLMLKKLPAETSPGFVINNEPQRGISGKIRNIGPNTVSYYIVYEKGAWKVSFYNIKHFDSVEHKRFDADKEVEAFRWALSKINKLQVKQ